MDKAYFFLAILVLIPTSAYAYIGPGVGLGAIATFIAITLGLILLVIGFLWYPLKRILRKRRQAQTENSTKNSPSDSSQ